MIKRSISMPVKPRYIEETPHLERSEEKEELYIEDDESENSQPFLDEFTSTARDNQSKGSSSRDSTQETLDEQTFKETIDEWTWNTRHMDLISKDEMQLCGFKEATHQPKTIYKITPDETIRVISKLGRENVSFTNIPQRSLRYCKDVVTTLVEQQWKYTFTMFISSFFLSWVIFTALWYLIAYAHGDFIFDPNTGERLGEGKEPCVVGATSLVGLFIYTVETQVTIGFGEKYPSEECPESVFLFVFQIIVSVAIEGAMIGIIYAKMAKPVKQISKLKFSKKAVIYRRDGELCFCFRVCDPREQQTIRTKIQVYIVEDQRTNEGEILKVHRELKLSGTSSPIIVWSEVICHIIDESSPLEKYTANNFRAKQDFEIIVSLVGASPTTGQLTESRTSYLPSEILFGQRFPNIVHYDWMKETHLIDYDNFNTTVPVSKFLCGISSGIVQIRESTIRKRCVSALDLVLQGKGISTVIGRFLGMLVTRICTIPEDINVLI